MKYLARQLKLGNWQDEDTIKFIKNISQHLILQQIKLVEPIFSLSTFNSFKCR